MTLKQLSIKYNKWHNAWRRTVDFATFAVKRGKHRKWENCTRHLDYWRARYSRAFDKSTYWNPDWPDESLQEYFRYIRSGEHRRRFKRKHRR